MQRNSHRIVSFCLSLLITCAGLTSLACKPAQEERGTQSEPFEIGMVTFAGYAPLYLAKEKGFFGDLDVRLQRIEEIPSIRAGVESRRLDGYLATLDIFLDSDQKPPGIGVWVIDESAGGDGVVVREGLDTLAELKGKIVAAEPGLPPNFVLLYLLHKNDMALSDVAFQDMTTQNAATAFAGGSIDAAGLYEPYLTLAKTQRPGSQIVVSSADVPGLIVDLIFVRDDVARDRAPDVARLVEGWERAVDYIGKNKQESYRIMAKAFQLEEEEFAEIVGGIKWLSGPENRVLFGSPAAPGPLYQNFGIVRDVLKRNRASVYPAEASAHLSRNFIGPNGSPK